MSADQDQSALPDQSPNFFFFFLVSNLIIAFDGVTPVSACDAATRHSVTTGNLWWRSIPRHVGTFELKTFLKSINKSTITQYNTKYTNVLDSEISINL